MEGNLCDVNHLDSNARLPPRKRLLAGLKNQNAAAYGNRHSSSSSSSSNFSPCGGFDLFIDRWMGSRESNVNRSPEEIIEASKLAVRFAETARSTAELKAAIAVKAIDAAKEALELSATIAEEVSRRERRVKKLKTMKKKMKKKKQVQLLVRNLGRKPRQTKNSSQLNLNQSCSNSKSNIRNKRLKQIIPENLDDPSDEMKSDDDDDGSSEETHSVESDENASISIDSIQIDDNSGAESSQRKKSGVKRNRFKHKNHPY